MKSGGERLLISQAGERTRSGDNCKKKKKKENGGKNALIPSLPPIALPFSGGSSSFDV